MWFKASSILDYQQAELCPDIWDENKKLKGGVRQFILTSISGFFGEISFKNHENFIEDVLIGSSLATYFYKQDSDFDIKIVININSFKKNNPEYANSTSDDIIDELWEAEGKTMWLEQFVPGTQHQMDPYFVTAEEVTKKHLIKFDSLYSIGNNMWLKDPKKIVGRVSQSYVLNYAKNIAQQYLNKISSDIDRVRRDSIDFLLLRDYLRNLDQDDLQKLKVDFERMLDEVNISVEKLIQDKNIIKGLRKKVFTKQELDTDLERLLGSINYSDENLIFKVIQRYGYLRILSEIGQRFKDQDVAPDDVEELLEITESY